MIGDKIYAPASSAPAAWLFGIGAPALVGWSLVAGSPHPAVAAILPLLLAGAILWTRPRAFHAEFTDSALVVPERELVIPYEAIQGLRCGRQLNPPADSKRSFPIDVVHSAGALHIPRKLNVPSARVYHFLLDNIPLTGNRDINPALADFARREQKEWGTDHVYCYQRRQHRGASLRHSRGQLVGLAILVTGILWGGIGGAFLAAHIDKDSGGGWIGGGILLFLIGLFTFLVSASLAHPLNRRLKKASLVISPGGLALVQGDLCGQLSWDEVQDVKWRTRARGIYVSSAHAVSGIVLSVAGANIMIADVYDRPLALIHENILNCWQ